MCYSSFILIGRSYITKALEQEISFLHLAAPFKVYYFESFGPFYCSPMLFLPLGERHCVNFHIVGNVCRVQIVNVFVDWHALQFASPLALKQEVSGRFC